MLWAVRSSWDRAACRRDTWPLLQCDAAPVPTGRSRLAPWFPTAQHSTAQPHVAPFFFLSQPFPGHFARRDVTCYATHHRQYTLLRTTWCLACGGFGRNEQRRKGSLLRRVPRRAVVDAARVGPSRPPGILLFVLLLAGDRDGPSALLPAAVGCIAYGGGRSPKSPRGPACHPPWAQRQLNDLWALLRLEAPLWLGSQEQKQEK